MIKSEAGSLLMFPQEFQTSDQVYAKGASHCLKEQTQSMEAGGVHELPFSF